jgi:hypothetical protein
MTGAAGARAAALAAAACAAGACSGETGVITVGLTHAPGSTLLDGVQTLVVTLTRPRQVFTAPRTSDGFALAFELPATGELAALHVDGLDAGGTRIATGASPEFLLGAINGRVAIYMAAPDSVGAAPRALEPARDQLAGGALGYGAIVAGGRLASGAPSDELAIYNAFDHTLVRGLPLPGPRAGLVLGVGAEGAVYLFGGRDASDAPTATAWRFQTTVAPAGAYVDLGDKPGFARADQVAAPLGGDRYLISGMPPAELAGLDGAMVARTGIDLLPPAGVTVIASDGVTTAVFAGQAGAVRFRAGAFTELAIPEAARAGASVVALPAGQVGVVCGGPDAVRIDAASGAGETIPGVPGDDRIDCAAAVTARHVVIVGGELSGGVVADTVEVFDATTLAHVTSQPLVVPRTGALALALPNGQVLIAGGHDAAGIPVATLELFTPAPPP